MQQVGIYQVDSLPPRCSLSIHYSLWVEMLRQFSFTALLPGSEAVSDGYVEVGRSHLGLSQSLEDNAELVLARARNDQHHNYINIFTSTQQKHIPTHKIQCRYTEHNRGTLRKSVPTRKIVQRICSGLFGHARILCEISFPRPRLGVVIRLAQGLASFLSIFYDHR